MSQREDVEKNHILVRVSGIKNNAFNEFVWEWKMKIHNKLNDYENRAISRIRVSETRNKTTQNIILNPLLN